MRLQGRFTLVLAAATTSALQTSSAATTAATRCIPRRGKDLVYAGNGDDTVAVSADDKVDIIDCGDGYDTVYVDLALEDKDDLRHCEQVLYL